MRHVTYASLDTVSSSKCLKCVSPGRWRLYRVLGMLSPHFWDFFLQTTHFIFFFFSNFAFRRTP